MHRDIPEREGGTPADWDAEDAKGVTKNKVKMQRKRISRVMRLVGQKKKTAGVLNRGSSNAVGTLF